MKRNRLLWIFVIIFFVIGDYITTYIGIRYFGLVENNPFARSFLDIFHLTAILPFKLFLVIAAYGINSYISDYNENFAIVIPLSYALIGVLVTVINIMNISIRLIQVTNITS
jgi:hypothetical protein